MTTDLHHLIGNRLAAVDAARERAEQPRIYVLVGERKSGDYAEFHLHPAPLRKGDPLPANWIHWDYHPDTLRRWFEANTVKTGPNVWRWK